MGKTDNKSIVLITCFVILTVAVFAFTNFREAPVTTAMAGATGAAHNEIVGSWIIVGIGEDVENLERTDNVSFSITFNDDGTADTSFLGTMMWKTDGNVIKLYKNLAFQGSAVIKDGKLMYYDGIGDECVIMEKMNAE